MTEEKISKTWMSQAEGIVGIGDDWRDRDRYSGTE